MRAVLLVAVLAYAALAAFAYFLSDRLMFLPPRPTYRAGQLPITMIPGADGASLATLYLPNPRAAITLVYAHGNAEDLGLIAPMLEELQRHGYAVLAFDYRGYGLSTGGPPTTSGAIRDMESVYQHAVHTLGVQPSRLVLYGRSVGGGPTADLATRVPSGGLVLESTFTSAFVVMTRVPLLPFDRFPNLRHIRQVHVPVLIIHGTADAVIPVSHGRRLYEAASEPKQALWVEGAGHNDLTLVAGQRYWDALAAFARTVTSR
ncbi:MAG TPA: alpha/beta hydrolase [Gemmatimonadaceae bacterium]